jgi:spore maturation protein CgeB
MRVLFLGQVLEKWESGWQRQQAMREAGHEVVTVDWRKMEKTNGNDHQWERIAQKLARRSRAILGWWQKHRSKAILEWVRKHRDWLRSMKARVVWIEWPLFVSQEVLQEMRKLLEGAVFVSYQDDNPFGRRRGERGWWSIFLETLACYDAHLVKRESDVQKYVSLGARNVKVFVHGYLPSLFRPAGPSEVGLCERDVIFVGTNLDDRAVFFEKLLREGIKVEIFGNLWKKSIVYWKQRKAFRPALLGEAYVRALWKSKIGLGLVSSSNLDEYTYRTLEIPATGTFLLAKRTKTHQAWFEEGQEAEFFGSVEECVDKIKFYVRCDTARRRIALAGYLRCLRSDYRLTRRVSEALTWLNSLQ